jgi:hypothetical protein
MKSSARMDGKLTYAGRVGTGMSTATLKMLRGDEPVPVPPIGARATLFNTTSV